MIIQNNNSKIAGAAVPDYVRNWCVAREKKWLKAVVRVWIVRNKVSHQRYRPKIHGPKLTNHSLTMRPWWKVRFQFCQLDWHGSAWFVIVWYLDSVSKYSNSIYSILLFIRLNDIGFDSCLEPCVWKNLKRFDPTINYTTPNE